VTQLRFALARRTRRHEDTKKMRVTLQARCLRARASRGAGRPDPRMQTAHVQERLASVDLIALLTPAAGSRRPAARQQRSVTGISSRLRGFASSWSSRRPKARRVVAVQRDSEHRY
jgi:hypothetical protein